MSRRIPSILTVAALAVAVLMSSGLEDSFAGKKKDKKKDAAQEASDQASSTTMALPAEAAAAFIGETPITVGEIDQLAAGRMTKVRQEEFKVRSQILERLLTDRLLDMEASERGISREELLLDEVTSQVEDPPDAEIEAYYNKNKKRYGTKELEQVKPQIISILRSQSLGNLQRSYVRSLRQKHHVRVLLEPPRVQVAQDDDAARGPETAPVTIVEFSDYQCPYCSRAEATINTVMEKYGEQIRLVYRDYPLSFHKNAQKAAEASECADEQGKFWEMHGAMFADQSKLASAQLVETASTIGLDADSFKECLTSGKYAQEVANDFADGKSYGVTGTPTFFINGIMMVGAKSVDAFSAIIDQELDRTAN